MENIAFVRYSPHTSTKELTSKVVECFQVVFADSPWNEWKSCSVCKKFWGKKDIALLEASNFHHCNVPLIDYWPQEQVTSDLFHEITKESSCWLALNGSQVVGFTWGYQVNPESLEKKLGVSFSSTFISKFGRQSKIAYQDEVGVISEFREHKIAKSMVKLRLSDFLAQDLKVGVVRTREFPEPSKTFLWYKKIGYETIFQYPKEDGRVILARSLDNLSTLL